MQEAIAARLKGYPQRAHRQMHRARVLIPAKAAAVLHEDAQLTGPAVEAFYNRDADDMRAAAHMMHFAPQVPPTAWLSRTHCLRQSSHVQGPSTGHADAGALAQEMISVVVTLNRCMYAQLEQQDFQAPSSFSILPAKSPQHGTAQRGMKLTVGLEMLYARSRASWVLFAPNRLRDKHATPMQTSMQLPRLPAQCSAE